jgi:hypothetical protein
VTVQKTEFCDGGWYRCEASNRLGRCQTQATVSVQCPPTIDYDEKLRERQVVKAGATLILLVNVTGMPTPKVPARASGGEDSTVVSISEAFMRNTPAQDTCILSNLVSVYLIRYYSNLKHLDYC